MKACMWMAFLERNGRLKILKRVFSKKLMLSLPNVLSYQTARVKKILIRYPIDETEHPRLETTMRVY